MTDARIWRRNVLCLVAAIGLALFAVNDTAAAQQRSYWIEDFSATLEIGEDGVLRVNETIRFHFDGSYNGIYRDIPVSYVDEVGFDYKLRLTVESVTGDNGLPLQFDVGRPQRGRIRITVWVPGANDASRTVNIGYRVRRALRFFPEHDELYWNVTGTEWGVPIHKASAHVVLPRSLDGGVRYTAYVGIYGHRGDAWRGVQPTPREVRIETTTELGYGEGLTVVVGWPKGVVPEPAFGERAGGLLADNWPLLIPPLVFLLMLVLWRSYGKDPEINRSIMPLYEPPGDLTPAEMGTLVDERVDQRDIVATVIDLAVRGYIRIEEKSEDSWIGDKTNLHVFPSAARRCRPERSRTRSHGGLLRKGTRSRPRRPEEQVL